MKLLRIAMVAQAVYPVRGGVEMHVHNLVTLLQQQGHEITVLTSRPVPQDPAHIYKMRDRLGIPAMIRAILQGNFDVVHAHGVRDPFSAAAIMTAHRNGIRTCVTPHCFYEATNLFGHIKRFLYDGTLGRMALAGSDSVICLTEIGKKDALRQPGIRPDGIHIIPNAIRLPPPVSAEAIREFREQWGDFLLCVGRLDRVKRGDFLIAALKRLPASLKLVFIGPDAGAYAAWQEQVKTANLTDRVVFLLNTPDETLWTAYAAARAVVMASAQEGLPTVLLEAMASGTPVIASNSGGIPELITHGQNGLLFAYDDEQAYAECVLRILQSDPESLIQQARRLVEAQYTWKTNARRVVEVYGRG
ncbi:glycosyltransferase family 4 protein [Terriglobus albidus]|uniref:glycosyltransferase family 4 protein n=1 Tax=Terriglobus albidus TaxID=1592106 RepID=UPI0021DFBEDA|nr:glycosyltransferase family 4 protein [Terriglobus albidus]